VEVALLALDTGVLITNINAPHFTKVRCIGLATTTTRISSAQVPRLVWAITSVAAFLTLMFWPGLNLSDDCASDSLVDATKESQHLSHPALLPLSMSSPTPHASVSVQRTNSDFPWC